jgi:RimJ/RimL family protein N-acetyltransferase
MAVMVLNSGPHVILRDRLPSDADRYLYWLTHGEWHEYDAPWEEGYESLSPERQQKVLNRFIVSCDGEQPRPRRRAIIADRESIPMGWVSSYTQEDAPGTRFVGIDICEDDCLNRGLGTEALQLWIDYLFANTDVQRLGLETWSFNPRMIRVAIKAGFVLDEIKYQEIEWQGKAHDLHRFRLLRSEWEASAKETRVE